MIGVIDVATDSLGFDKEDGPGVDPESVVRITHGLAVPQARFRYGVLGEKLPTLAVSRIPSKRVEERVYEARAGVGLGEAA